MDRQRAGSNIVSQQALEVRVCEACLIVKGYYVCRHCSCCHHRCRCPGGPCIPDNPPSTSEQRLAIVTSLAGVPASIELAAAQIIGDHPRVIRCRDLLVFAARIVRYVTKQYSGK